MNTISRAARSSHKSNIIGGYLKEKRLAAGRSQLSVAQAAGVAESTISRIESGKLLPTVDVLTCIGEALDIDLAELLGLLGSRTGRDLPEFEDYLREKYGLAEHAIAEVAEHFRRALPVPDEEPAIDE